MIVILGLTALTLRFGCAAYSAVAALHGERHGQPATGHDDPRRAFKRDLIFILGTLVAAWPDAEPEAEHIRQSAPVSVVTPAGASGAD